VGLEVGLLRFGPALLGGQGVTEGEVRADCVGLAGEAVLQAAFGLHRVVALGAGEAGQGRRVEGVGDEGAAEELPGELVLPICSAMAPRPSRTSGLSGALTRTSR
jgi:hypothetical protein